MVHYGNLNESAWSGKLRCLPIQTSALTALILLLLPTAMRAQITSTTLPTGGSVVQGNVNIPSAAVNNTLTITQNTSSAVINWNSFSIGSQETVAFNQTQGSSSVVVNRVTGTTSSILDGALNANGNVFLINANGILIDSSAKLNVGGFVASTLDIPDTANFGVGSNVFTQGGSSASTPSIVNQGTITVNRNGGYVALLGASVTNQGTITASNDGTSGGQGAVALAAGGQITLNFNGNSMVGVTVNASALNALVQNEQAIVADGGNVYLTAKAADDLLSATVSNTGTIQAKTVNDLKGSISLTSNGIVSLGADSLMDASGSSADTGGTILTGGSSVSIADGAQVITKSTSASGEGSSTWSGWTIDSSGFTVAASGGNITGAELGSALNQGNVKIVSSATSDNGLLADVNILDPVSWSSGSGLYLHTTDNIGIDKAVTASGAGAAFALNTGEGITLEAPVTLSGANAAMTLNSNEGIAIDAPITLSGDGDAMTMNTGASYDYSILTPASYSGAVLDENGVPQANTDTSGGVYGSITLSGNSPSLTINGNSYTLIQNMNELSQIPSCCGYYAIAENLDASGTTYTSALIPNLNSSVLTGLGHTINNLTITGSTSNSAGDYEALIGQAYDSTIRDLGVTNVSISGNSFVGALLADGETSSTGTVVQNAYSTGSVTGVEYVGGLVGAMDYWAWNYDSLITHSFSSANVTGLAVPSGDNTASYTSAGGLVGYADFITYSDATGNVIANNANTVGGLTGYLISGWGGALPSVDMSYATGKVTNTETGSASGDTGGLIGNSTGNVTNSFATGDVSGVQDVGGLIGVQGDSLTYVLFTDYEVKNCWASGTVSDTGPGYSGSIGAGVGGLIGSSFATAISDSFATGDVSLTYNLPENYADQTSITSVGVGGLVGYLEGGSITGSYATGNVTATSSVTVCASCWEGTPTFTGGLVGMDEDASIDSSFASGNVSGQSYVGGLVGFLYNNSEYGPNNSGDYVYSQSNITNSSASGNVSGINDVGGVVGGTLSNAGEVANYLQQSDISNVTSSGTVSGSGSDVGGIVGSLNSGTVQDSFSSGNVSGASDVGGIVGSQDSSSTVTGGSSFGFVKSNAIADDLSSQASTAAEIDTAVITSSSSGEDSVKASGDLSNQLSDSISVDLPSSYSATLKTIVVDGVEYQIQTDENTPDKDKEKKDNKQDQR